MEQIKKTHAKNLFFLQFFNNFNYKEQIHINAFALGKDLLKNII